MIPRLLLCLLLAGLSWTARASIDSFDFANDEQRARYQQLAEELRCPKCQNQNLIDSNAEIAADLRRELHEQILAGKSDSEIVDFMRERYGDFVLYKPRVQRSTWLLWYTPPVLLLILLLGVLRFRQPASSPAPLIPAATPFPAGPAQPSPGLSGSTVRWVSLAVALVVAAGSVLLYRQLGAFQALQITELSHRVFNGPAASDSQQVEQQVALLAELDDWLAARPEDEKFLYLRARLLAEGGDWARARADYQALVSRFPEQDNLLAEYGQVLFLENQRHLTDDARAFLERALLLNPQNATALGLLGMQAFEQRDYRQAVTLWQRLLETLPAGSPPAETIAAGIRRARELGQLPADTAPAPAAGTLQLSVSVSLAGTVTAAPGETVFVLLRAVQGPRMPLAAARTTVAALASPVVLDTASSPMGQSLDPTGFGPLEVVARLSRSGQAMAAAGDWEGLSAPFDPAQPPAALSIQIDRPAAVPAR